jgi:hypothetical protein
MVALFYLVSSNLAMDGTLHLAFQNANAIA